MMARALLLSACSLSLLLAGCLDDGGALAARVEGTESARVQYAASALKNFALSKADGRGAVGVVQSGPNGLRSMTCARYDGQGGGLFFAWHDSTIGKSDYDGRAKGAITANLVREVGPKLVRQWRRGELFGAVIPPNCPLPSLPDGSPVVVVPVSIPDGSYTPATKEERRADSCPEGEAGAAVYIRSVEFTSDGRRVDGPWRLDSLAGCREAAAVAVTVAGGAAPVRSVGSGSEIEKDLAGSLPDNCKRVTLTHRKGRAVASEKTFDTRDFVEVSAPVAGGLPVGVPKEPKAAPLPISELGVCEDGMGGVAGVIRLSPRDKAGYIAAMAEISFRLQATFANVAVDCVRVFSSTEWPYLQAFWTKTPTGWRVTNRLYATTVDLSWSARAGMPVTWNEFHKIRGYSWFVWRSVASMPSVILSHPHHWYAVEAESWPRFVMSSIAERNYPLLVGENTQGGLPVPYADEAGAWSDTTNNAALFAAADWPRRCGSENLGCSEGPPALWHEGLDFINIDIINGFSSYAQAGLEVKVSQ